MLQNVRNFSLVEPNHTNSHSVGGIVAVHATERNLRKQPQINTNLHRWKSTGNRCSSVFICGSNCHSRNVVIGYAGSLVNAPNAGALFLSENPYAPPQDGQHEYLPHAKPYLKRLFLMLPFSFLAALAGGAQNENPNLMGIELLIHPMAPSGLMFGVFAGIAGCLIIPRGRLWIMPLVPVAGTLGFGVTGLLMNQADRQLQDGGNVAVFVAELCFASLTGMAMIAASFVMARIFSISSAGRFTIIGACMGALSSLTDCLRSLRSLRASTGRCSAGSF